MNTIKKVFDEIAEKYDSQRRILIPCFDDFYTVSAEIANTEKSNPAILDIGAGTGLMTKYFLEKYPEANFTLIDLSDEMLNIAKKRFSDKKNFKYIAVDYSSFSFDHKFDIIVSCLSIHHLENADKEILYRKFYSLLNENGVFINADQFLGPSTQNEKDYHDNWIKKIGPISLSPKEKEAAYERMKLDKPATLDDNLKWLKNIGFKDVDVYYKYYNFGVIFGRK